MTRGDVTTTTEIPPPAGAFERFKAAAICRFLRRAFSPVMGPSTSAQFQRRWVRCLSSLMPGRRGMIRQQITVAQVPVEITQPKATAGSSCSPGVILYLHGGGFCVCSPATHRSVTSVLAAESQMPVWAPDYRLAPEHPYPAALDDVLTTYQELRRTGYAPEQIVIGGDSAGGALALALTLRLRQLHEPAPAGLLLLSPLTNLDRSAHRPRPAAGIDPMIRQGWVDQFLEWYNCPANTLEHRPLETDLTGLPPMLIQVGDLELLLPDSVQLASQAAKHHVDCRLEIHRNRWHVFQLHSRFLRSSTAALKTLATFARSVVTQ